MWRIIFDTETSVLLTPAVGLFDSADGPGTAIQQWLDTSEEPPLLYLVAKPAQGKSVSVAHLVGYCQANVGDGLYFFCRHDHPATCSAAMLLRSIAFQWAQFDHSVRKTYLGLEKQGHRATIMSLFMLWEKLFREIFVDRSRKHVKLIWWVIDGFDELGTADRTKFARLLQDVESFGPAFRGLVVGRHDRDIFQSIKPPVRMLRIHEKRTSEDIQIVVSASIAQSCPDLEIDVQTSIIDLLVEKVGGLFL